MNYSYNDLARSMSIHQSVFHLRKWDHQDFILYNSLKYAT